MRPNNKLKRKKTKNNLSSLKILKLEKLMIKSNLKLTKSDISLAARKACVPINKALLHFQCLRQELSDDKIYSMKALTKTAKEMESRIIRIYKRFKKRKLEDESNPIFN